MGKTISKHKLENMKSIAIYYPSLEHSGGIERVVIELCRIFHAHEYPCILITDEAVSFYANRMTVSTVLLPKNKEDRHAFWIKTLSENKIQYVITNGGFGTSWQDDIQSIHNAGVRIINTVHFSFPSPILFNEAWRSYQEVLEIGLACDAVATVSKIDALWWRSLGCNAHHVQNPFTYYEHNDAKIDYTNHTMIWVGRGAPQKKPLEAIKVIKKVVNEIPDARLIMVGLEDGGRSYKSLVDEWGLKDHVTFVAPTNEIGEYYQKASLHLLTSITESFCLVIAEAKSYKIPTVMYEIPFLELIEDKKGVYAVKQGDSDRAARCIVKLFSNPELLKIEGEEAFTTLARFNDEEVIRKWEAIFHSLEKGESIKPNIGNISVQENPYETVIREIYSAWMNHCEQNVWKIEFFDNIERATGKSAKGIIDGITNRIIEPLKHIKLKIK